MRFFFFFFPLTSFVANVCSVFPNVNKRDALSPLAHFGSSGSAFLILGQSLTQRALAAEAEAELSGIKLARAFEELRVDRAGCVLCCSLSLSEPLRLSANPTPRV